MCIRDRLRELAQFVLAWQMNDATLESVLAWFQYQGDASSTDATDGVTTFLIFVVSAYPNGVLQALPEYTVHTAVTYSPSGSAQPQVRLHRKAERESDVAQDKNVAALAAASRMALGSAQLVAISSYWLAEATLPVTIGTTLQQTLWVKAECVSFVTNREQPQAHSAVVVTDSRGQVEVQASKAAAHPTNAVVLWQMELPHSEQSPVLSHLRDAIGAALHSLVPALAVSRVIVVVVPSSTQRVLSLSCSAPVPGTHDTAQYIRVQQLLVAAVSSAEFPIKLLELLPALGHARMQQLQRGTPTLLTSATTLALQPADTPAAAAPKLSNELIDEHKTHHHPTLSDVLAGFVVGVATTIFVGSLGYANMNTDKCLGGSASLQECQYGQLDTSPRDNTLLGKQEGQSAL
eukprot:TRINITY_DN11799_c0_g1_i4.p1 TRINITY_DN11799_c0_g1~~TRINITY_DN11799_c0_g1_i4.p1  ORF type:complete len:405 (+),score=106.73 TRINITY_DN11799_c0_g1_i4:114-1328(+)